MSLGSSASFRRIVPSRDTSTMESEIPSFRDAKPKQSVLAPRHCEERSDVAILSAGKDCFTPVGVRNDVKTTACSRNASEQAVPYTIRPSEEQSDP